MSIFLTHRRIVKDSVKKSIKKYLAIHPTAEAAGFLAGFYKIGKKHPVHHRIK